MKRIGAKRIIGLVVLLVIGFAQDARTEDLDPESMRLKLKAACESWETFSCRYESWMVDEQGRRSSRWVKGTAGGLRRRELIKASGGRWAASTVHVSAKRNIATQCFVEDGQRRYETRFLNDDPEWPVSISSQGSAMRSRLIRGNR